MKTLVTVLLVVFCAGSYAADWPQWRGDGRKGISGETGLLKKWPTGGPKLLWTAEDIGKGNSSMSIADGTIYVTGNKGEGKDQIEKGEGVHWAHPAISDGVLYIRHAEFLMAYDIKSK